MLQRVIVSSCLPVIMLLYRTKWENDFQEKHIKSFSNKESNCLVCLHVEAIMDAIKMGKNPRHINSFYSRIQQPITTVFYGTLTKPKNHTEDFRLT